MIRNLYAGIKNYTFSEKSVPWILLFACLAGFGVFIPSLGYFQDDWTFVYNHFKFGEAGIFDFLYYDGRPFAAWIYNFGFQILGYKPIAWQISVLLIKWLTATFLWLSFRIIWPKSVWQNLTAALIFSLYPFFTLQPLAVAYVIHWVGYFLYSVSIYFMLKSLSNRYWLYTSLSIIAQALCLFTLEYFAGIDLLRPLFLWLALRNSLSSFRPRLKSMIRYWAPYLVISIAYFIWRGFVYEAPAGRNSPIDLVSILNNPVPFLISIVSVAIPDIVLVLIASWYKILDPNALNFAVSVNRNSFLMGVVAFCVFFYYLSRQKDTEGDGPSNNTWAFFGVGLIALLLGLLPAYAGGYVIHTKLPPWNSRFSLGSLFGAALILTAFIDAVVRYPKTRWLIISVSLGLLVGWHVRSTNDFRWAWDKQVDFYRQLYLRAPALEPGTALLSEEEFLSFMGNYSTSYGIDLIYSHQEQSTTPGPRETDYWLFPFAEFYTELDGYLSGESFSIGTDSDTPRAGISFQGEPEGTIVISFTPELGQCLWVMRPEYAASKTLSPTLQQLSSISHIDRIKPAPENPDSFLIKYLYTQPVQDWCYYYEKADLANQYEDWEEVVSLWEAASKAGRQPDDGFEYLPFIEAFAHTNDWEAAKQFSRTSQKTMQGIEPLLCQVWSKLENETPDSPEKAAVLTSAREELRCDQQ